MASRPQSQLTERHSPQSHARRTPSSTSGTTSSSSRNKLPVKLSTELGCAARSANIPISTSFPLHILPADKSSRRVRPMVQRLRSQVETGLKDVINKLAKGGLNWPLVLCGGVGTGKSCTALCMCDGVPGSIYKTMEELCEDLSQAMRGELYDHMGLRMTVGRYWSEWTSAPFVVLDEVGVRNKVSDYYVATLLRAIDARQGAPACFVSNLQIDEIDSIIDDRVASRLSMGSVYIMHGKDRRQGGNNAPQS